MPVHTTGILYIVATPIGNLEDLSPRAIRILGDVDIIAAEDTRHSKNLLGHFGIDTKLLSYHDFNEHERSRSLVEYLQAGKNVALISDAGTPLISDPGYRLVRAAHQHGIRVVPIPGPSAAISALSAAGLPSDRFAFEGYPPEKHAARVMYLRNLTGESRTMVFYEAPHRIQDLFEDMQEVFGAQRQAAIAREMTKKFETVQTGTVGELLNWVAGDKNHRKGEFVVIIQGAEKDTGRIDRDLESMLMLLLAELPLKKAAAIVSQVSGVSKNVLYKTGLKLQEKPGSGKKGRRQ